MLSIGKPEYTLTITNEPDEDYRKYLARRIGADRRALKNQYTAGARPLDISLDDSEGDVVAGVACMLAGESLHIEMLWVQSDLRQHGIGCKLLQVAESIAFQRGCIRVRVCATQGIAFYQKMGYHVTGKLQQFPHGDTLYWLSKDLTAEATLMEEAMYEGPA